MHVLRAAVAHRIAHGLLGDAVEMHRGLWRGDLRVALVLHLEPELETSGPRFHFSWKTNEPYGGNDRPAPAELTMETGQPLVGSVAPTLHIYVEPHTPGIDRRTELWLPGRSLLMDASAP